MCGRYVDPFEAALERFWTVDRRNWRPFSPPRYNVAPTMQVPVVLRAEDGAIEMCGARWGLIPHWWKQDKPPSLTFNARSEEAQQKPMWRDALRYRRCLMPIRGWYEWNENEPVTSVSGKGTNQPWYHHNPADQVLGVAGLWAVWQRTDLSPITSCALLSKAAAPSVAHVHHRMPVILAEDHFAAWLDPATSADDVQELITTARQDFVACRVSTRVNNVRNDSADLLEPVR